MADLILAESSIDGLGDVDARRRAWAESAHRPLPTTETEAWRRTDVSGLDLARFRFASPGAVAATQSAADEALADGVGTDVRLNRPRALAEQGVLFMDLAEAQRAHSALIERHLGRAVPSGKDKFSALNAALWNRGVFVHVPRGVAASVPLRALWGGDLADGRALFPRVLLVAEAGSRVTFFDDYSAPDLPAGGAALAVPVTELFLGEGAEVTYVSLQRWGRGITHIAHQHAHLAKDARLTSLAVALGGSLSKADFGSELLAPGAESRLYGLVFGHGSQRLTHHTVQAHRAPKTTSEVLFKSAVRDTARSIVTGLLRIDLGAAQANAYQSAKAILLSPRARAIAIPMLEILDNDVKCGHGAAVGALDDDQRFYLMSRGLTAAESERAIVEGFFEDILSRVPVDGLRDRLREAIDQRLIAS